MLDTGSEPMDPAGSAEGVAIVGGGALGLTFAAALASRRVPVTIVVRSGSTALQSSGGEVRVDGALSLRVPIAAESGRAGAISVVDDPSLLPRCGAVLFTTKGHQLEQAAVEVARSARESIRGAWFAGFQNGVVKDEILAAAFGRDHTVGAATVLGASRAAPGEVSVAGLGTTYFGELDGGESTRAAGVRRALLEAGIPCELVGDVRSVSWTKYAHAVGVFGVSALTGLATGELFSRRPLIRAYRALIEEVERVAKAEGVEIGDYPHLPIRTYLLGSRDEMADLVLASSAGPAARPSFSSMAQDLASGRPTEVAEIFGDLAARARRHGLSAARAELVNDLVSGLEVRTTGPGDTPG